MSVSQYSIGQKCKKEKISATETLLEGLAVIKKGKQLSSICLYIIFMPLLILTATPTTTE